MLCKDYIKNYQAAQWKTNNQPIDKRIAHLSYRRNKDNFNYADYLKSLDPDIINSIKKFLNDTDKKATIPISTNNSKSINELIKMTKDKKLQLNVTNVTDTASGFIADTVVISKNSP